MRILRFIIPISLLVFFAACDEKSFNPRVPEGPDFSLTPRADGEAELVALQLTGDLLAPTDIYNLAKKELKIIRETWRDSIVHVNMVFEPYWRESYIRVRVNAETFDSMVAGKYHYWDSLNSYFPLDSIILSSNPVIGAWSANMYFKGRLNSCSLIDEYAGLPFVKSIDTDYKWIDHPVLLPVRVNSVNKYFFRFAYGDCYNGCIYNEFHYFTVENDSAIYHGVFIPYPVTQPRPPWADTARQALQDYFSNMCHWHS
jgi:hypothetical protein